MSVPTVKFLWVNFPQVSEPGKPVYHSAHNFCTEYDKHKPAYSISPPLCLRHTIVPSMQNTKCALVAHMLEAAECQFQYYAAFEWHKVAHILQYEESWAIEVTVWQIWQDQGVLWIKNTTEILNFHIFFLQNWLDDAFIISWNMYLCCKMKQFVL
jgi:hypothetical protein